MDPLTLNKNYKTLAKKKKKRRRQPVLSPKLAHCRNTVLGCMTRGMSLDATAALIAKEAAENPAFDEMWKKFFEDALGEVGSTMKTTPKDMTTTLGFFMHQQSPTAATIKTEKKQTKQSAVSAPQGPSVPAPTPTAGAGGPAFKTEPYSWKTDRLKPPTAAERAKIMEMAKQEAQPRGYGLRWPSLRDYGHYMARAFTPWWARKNAPKADALDKALTWTARVSGGLGAAAGGGAAVAAPAATASALGGLGSTAAGLATSKAVTIPAFIGTGYGVTRGIDYAMQRPARVARQKLQTDLQTMGDYASRGGGLLAAQTKKWGLNPQAVDDYLASQTAGMPADRLQYRINRGEAEKLLARQLEDGLLPPALHHLHKVRSAEGPRGMVATGQPQQPQQPQPTAPTTTTTAQPTITEPEVTQPVDSPSGGAGAPGGDAVGESGAPTSAFGPALPDLIKRFESTMPKGDQIWTDEQRAQIEANVLQRLEAGHKPKRKELYTLLSQYVANASEGDPGAYASKMAQIFGGGPPDHKTLANAVKEFGLKSGLSEEQLGQAFQDPGIIQRIISWFTDEQTPIHHKIGVALGIPLALIGGAMAMFGKGGMGGMLLAGLGGAGMLLPTGMLDPILEWSGLGQYLGLGEHEGVGGYGEEFLAPEAMQKVVGGPQAAPAAAPAVPLAEAAGTPSAAAGAPAAAPAQPGAAPAAPVVPAAPAAPAKPRTLTDILSGPPEQALEALNRLKPEDRTALVEGLKSRWPAVLVASGINKKQRAAAIEKGQPPPPPVTKEQVEQMRALLRQAPPGTV